MQHRNIVIFLSAILAAAGIIMALNLHSLYRESSYLPEQSVESIVSVLERDNIRIDPHIVSAKRERGTVYVCNSEDYNRTVAQLLGKSPAKAEYITPDGSIVVLENGAVFESGGNFSFRFDLLGKGRSPHNVYAVIAQAPETEGSLREETEKIVIDFLDSGSREFDSSGMSIVTTVESVVQSGGLCYAMCSRSIAGVAVTDNRAVCIIDGGRVIEAEGSWSFLTLGESYTAQLADIINILFSVRSAISDARSSPDETVTITSIDLCCSFYYYGDEEDFCLIPCWQITTDSYGNFIYNAIDSTLYTINTP